MIDDVLARIRPSEDEVQIMAERVERLLADAQQALDGAGVDAEATVQGSIAKDTWIAGSTDVDLFLLIDPDVDSDRFPSITETVADAVLEDAVARYAQHPYLVGGFEGLQVDLVPAYRVPEAGAHMSAVDRTPFHTEWVRANLRDEQRDEVRLTKQWMKGVGVYGAETATAGFSGYLVEVLVAAHEDFSGVLDWLAGGCRPRRIAIADDAVEQPAPLIVVDPVDPARNCAAAVAEETLSRAKEAARAYLQDPREAFFFPAPPQAAPAQVLADRLQANGERWVGLRTPAVDRMDILFPQFQKAAGRIADEWGRAGFDVHALHAWTDEETVGLQWRLDARPLPESKRHRGPPPDVGRNADRFRAKWDGHPDALGPCTVEDGRLVVDVAIRHRTPEAWLEAHLGTISLGKHVERVRPEAAVLTDPARVPSPWSPIVTDFILERPPWQR